MKPEFLFHYTLNTGYVRKSYPSEIKKTIYFRLHRIWRETQKPEGAEVMDDGCRAKATIDGRLALVTIFSPDGVPIVTSGISPTGDPEVWRLLHQHRYPPDMPLATKLNEPPSGPYIADRVELGAILYPSALQWTGDFCRCFGWMVTAPEAIRP